MEGCRAENPCEKQYRNKTPRVENQSTDRSLADVVGGFIADGKDTLMLSANAFNMFETMSSDGTDKIGLPGIFKIALYGIILIMVFVGIILGSILGRRL